MDPSGLFSLGTTIGEGINQFGLHLREDMQYKRSKKDAIEFWNMQNAYNAPQAQMQRLKAAGLNPHLVYGGSSGGVAGTAGGFQTPVNPSISERRSKSNVLSDYYDIKMKQATLSNVLAQNEAIREEAALKRAQIRNLGAGAARSEYDLQFETEFRPYSGEARRLAVEKAAADVKYQLSENERREALTAKSLKEATQRILLMRAQTATNQVERQRIQHEIHRIETDQQLKKLDQELRQLGINPSSPTWQLILGRILYNIDLPEYEGGNYAPRRFH